MAKKKSPGQEPPTKAVKIERALAGKAQLIATDKGIPLSEYIAEAIRSVVEKDWARMVKRMEGTQN